MLRQVSKNIKIEIFQSFLSVCSTSCIIEGSSENLEVSCNNLSKPPRWMITDLFASLAASLETERM